MKLQLQQKLVELEGKFVVYNTIRVLESGVTAHDVLDYLAENEGLLPAKGGVIDADISDDGVLVELCPITDEYTEVLYL